MPRRLAIAAGAAALVTLAACGGSATPSLAVPESSNAPVTSLSVPATPAASATTTVAAPCAERELTFDPANMDLSGPWLANDDGIYYLRQIEDALWWNGMSGQSGPSETLGREWNNVAFGQIKDDLTIELQWADVPRGQILGSGTLVWEIVDDGTGNTRLTKVSETGSGFGGAEFTPCAPG